MRRVTLHVPHDPLLFEPRQLLASALLRVGMNGTKAWLETFSVPFPRLFKEHRVALVLRGYHIEWGREFTFFDADGFEAISTLSYYENGRTLMHEGVVVANGWDDPVVKISLEIRPVLIQDESLAAKPGNLPSHLLAGFEQGQGELFAPSHMFSETVETFARDSTELTSGYKIRMMRYHCEMADQWAYTELANFVAQARDQAVEDRPELLRSRMMRMVAQTAKLSAPAYIYDTIEVTTRVREVSHGLTFLHELRRVGGDKRRLALVLERFEE